MARSGKTKVAGGWKPEGGTEAIVDLDQLPETRAPASNRLFLYSEEAGNELVDTLRGMGFEGSEPDH
jgi:hypothetical protein